MITPLEIQNKKFNKKTLNGYDPEEVDDFLDEIETLNSKLEHYTKIEDTLQSTLLMAQSAADEVKKAAQKEAEQTIREAENKAKEATADVDRQIMEKKKSLEDLQKQFDVYKAKMESLLISQLELIKEINKEDD